MKFYLPLPGRRLRRILTLLGQAALCCVLTAARLGGLYAPFSLAAAAAAGPGLPGLLSLLGVTGGALLFLDFQPGLRHAAAAVLLFAAQTAFCDTKFYRRPAFRPLTAALSQLLIQSVYLLYRPLSQWVLCLTASALLAAATALLTAHGTTLRQKGLLYAAALSLALVPVTVEGLFSVGKALLMAELLLLSRRLPPLTVGLAGACAGLAADLVPETPALLLTVAYGCGGALAAFYGRLPRILPAAAFSLPIMTLAVLLDAGPPRQLLLSCLAGGAAYLLLPRRWLPPCAERAARADAPGETAKPRRLEQSAAALRSLYDSFFRDTAPAPPENPSVIFDRAAEQVCRSCVLCAICWQQNYNAPTMPSTMPARRCCAAARPSRRISPCTSPPGASICGSLSPPSTGSCGCSSCAASTIDSWPAPAVRPRSSTPRWGICWRQRPTPRRRNPPAPWAIECPRPCVPRRDSSCAATSWPRWRPAGCCTSCSPTAWAADRRPTGRRR